MLLLACALTAAATNAFPAPQSRAEATRALRSPDAVARAEALVWLGEHGGMADAALLHERLRDENAFVRGTAEQALWLVWTRSGDAAIDHLMLRGIDLMSTGDLTAAIATFGDIVKRKPGFAEGWNKRATAYFLAGEYEKSIADCAEVLKRNPLHFGALSGLGQIYVQLERYEDALGWFRKALDVNPNMVGVELNIRAIETRLARERANTI